MTRRPHRGGVLLEVVVSMAIFVAAAMFTLRAMSDVLVGLDRAGREQQAVDLARSKLAELELGLVTIEDLRAGVIESVGSFESIVDERAAGAAPASSAWACEVQTGLGPVDGLSVVELTVFEDRGGFAGGAGALDGEVAPTVRFTLRQLMRLRDAPVEEYREDDLLRGLPEAAP